MNRAVLLAQQQQLRRPSSAPRPTGALAWFTAEQIMDVLGAPIENVRENWPHVAGALDELGIGDCPTTIAALGTIGVEVGSFAPINEYRNADGSIPNGWYSYGGGPLYHGRGFIQLTHDYNYAHYGKALGVDLLDNPNLALDPTIAARVLARYFAEHGIPAMAAAGLWTAIRRAVNGGTNGLDRFLVLVQTFDRLACP